MKVEKCCALQKTLPYGFAAERGFITANNYKAYIIMSGFTVIAN